MFYQTELSFFLEILTNMQLHYRIFPSANPVLPDMEKHLRKLMNCPSESPEFDSYLSQHIKPNVIYHIVDRFSCHYSCLLLPDTEEPLVLSIGPYVTELLGKTELMQIIEKNNLPPQIYTSCEKYFFNIPYLKDRSQLTVLLNSLGSRIWGGMEHFSVEFMSGFLSDTDNPPLPHTVVTDLESTRFDMQTLEQRYTTENEFLKAVSQGLSHKARMIIGNVIPSHTQSRAVDAMSSARYYLIVLNTLLRKAAENGSVHPLHIDQLSSDFAFKIDRCSSMENSQRLLQEMIHKYCLLVKNHSMKGYSLLVQKVITQIDSDLTTDLSLNALSARLNVNASYLSSLFKKETGSTLTDYVNHRRIEHGILLLNSTTLQIQTIAQYCGISDVNYFTKLFKRYIGKTPKEYRESVHHSSRK